jgi:hypothetical protein
MVARCLPKPGRHRAPGAWRSASIRACCRAAARAARVAFSAAGESASAPWQARDDRPGGRAEGVVARSGV